MSVDARRRAAAAVAVLALGSCTGGTERSAPLPEGRQVVDVTMEEYVFAFAGGIQAGQTLFRVRNSGQLDHAITLYLLPDDLPPLDQQLRGNERRNVAPVVQAPARRPGGTQRFVVDLTPGQRYGLVCFVMDPDGANHAVKGMNAEFRPPGPDATPPGG